LASQAIKEFPAACEILQYLPYLRHHIAFVGQGHLVSHLGMNDIPGAAEVDDHWHGAAREGFEDYARTVIANGWKHEHVSGSQAGENLGMAEPAAESNSLLDSKGCCELLKAVLLRSVTDHGKAGQIAPQKGSRRAQSKITGLSGN
jgi:hypothetical protein